MKTFQTDVTCKIIVSNMLMFRQEFNYSEFAISHPTVTSFFKNILRLPFIESLNIIHDIIQFLCIFKNSGIKFLNV
jgi:hypothetical protein